MTLTHLNIHQLRNIHLAQITLNPRYNIFHGLNGSGKTSILEAIYLLSSGHSFRTRETSPLITHHSTELTVYARTTANDSISIQKSNSGSTQVKINQQACLRSSELAHFLPCQLIYQDIFQIMDAGPAVRRSMLDWGLFHVKQSYHTLWKEYRHVLKQRNALLRQRTNEQQCIPWNKLIVDMSYELDRLRVEYFKDWSEAFQLYLSQLTEIPCTISYYKGWDKKETGRSLATILTEQYMSDCHRQYTHSGAHQADILFNSTLLKAKQTLSRGQQKIILIALKLAQAQLLSTPCLYLFDDITTELDAMHVKRLIKCICQLKGQFFLTTIDGSQFSTQHPLDHASIFMLENGRLSSP
ncbi:MAG: DNA replication/repair protein RecF [Legionellaceae bacterium]|nr:DNA replication/repair protein RecF [Legionellaceae bacterium]